MRDRRVEIVSLHGFVVGYGPELEPEAAYPLNEVGGVGKAPEPEPVGYGGSDPADADTGMLFDEIGKYGALTPADSGADMLPEDPGARLKEDPVR